MVNHSINFFDKQFQNQVNKGDFSLNPFEQLALPFLKGKVLDLGCGLGNLSIEAARRGASVLALDASETAIEYIHSVAVKESLVIQAQLADLSTYKISENYDVIVSIGLLMFMEKSKAYEMLNNIKLHVVSGGYAIINVLIEGTTYLEMFDAKEYYLFGNRELQQQFEGWDIKQENYNSFESPSRTIKKFITIVAHKP